MCDNDVIVETGSQSWDSETQISMRNFINLKTPGRHWGVEVRSGTGWHAYVITVRMNFNFDLLPSTYFRSLSLIFFVSDSIFPTLPLCLCCPRSFLAWSHSRSLLLSHLFFIVQNMFSIVRFGFPQVRHCQNLPFKCVFRKYSGHWEPDQARWTVPCDIR